MSVLRRDVREDPERDHRDREVARLAAHAIDRCAAGRIHHGEAERDGERQRRHERAVDAPHEELERSADHGRSIMLFAFVGAELRLLVGLLAKQVVVEDLARDRRGVEPPCPPFSTSSAIASFGSSAGA
jgi:hypothetical protein